MKTIKGDLILTKDTTFDESIKVEGNIEGYFNLKVIGNIVAWNIVALDIDAWNIDVLNIDALDIDALDINAWNIDVLDIDAQNIVALDINARNIVAWNIVAWNIVALDIDAWNIVALDIIYCETIKLKDKTKGKIKAKALIQKRSKLEVKEWKI